MVEVAADHEHEVGRFDGCRDLRFVRWGADEERATAVAERLECGTTFVNTHAELLPTIPFGGSKWSGLGHENGVEGLLAFTESQVVYLKKAQLKKTRS